MRRDRIRGRFGLLAASGLAVGCFGLGAGVPAAAADTICTGAISNTHISGGVTVPVGQTCTLTNDTVGGSVKDYGTLTASATTISGSVHAFPGSTITLDENTAVGGSLTIDAPKDFLLNCVGVSGNLIVKNVAPGDPAPCLLYLGGNLSVINNKDDVQFGGLHVGGSLTVTGNTGDVTLGTMSFGGGGSVTHNADVVLTDLTFGGALLCSANTLITGSGNTAAGGLHGQCSGLG